MSGMPSLVPPPSMLEPLTRTQSGKPSQQECNAEIIISSRDDQYAPPLLSETAEQENIIMVERSEKKENTTFQSEVSSPSNEACRYCYDSVPSSDNASACRCRGALCEECLHGELELTLTRGDSSMYCTVCKTPYQLETKTGFFFNFECFHFLMCQSQRCGLANHNWFASRGHFGFFCVIVGVTAWLVCTILLLSVPFSEKQLCLYFVVFALDCVMGVILFYLSIHSRWLTPFYFTLLYVARLFIILLFIKRTMNTTFQTILWTFFGVSAFGAMLQLICAAKDIRFQWSAFVRNNVPMYLGNFEVRLSGVNAERNG